MKVAVVYADPARPLQLSARLDAEECSVEQALELSGLLKYRPEINLKTQKVGVFGKLVKVDSLLKDGDRVEVYQKITRKLDDDDDDDED